MNSDNGAFSGPTNTTESNAPVTLTSPPQTAAVLSTSPIDTTTPADTIKPPIISVSAPDGSEELRVTSLLGAAHTAYHKSRPHAELDLLKQYGLSWIEAKVARVNQKTGEKINRLRRSYEGQIKSFSLAGRNKAIKHNEKTDGLKLLDLGNIPSEDYRAQRVNGKELTQELSDGVQTRLEKALNLQPGKVPRNAEWEHVLGHDKKGATEDAKVKKQEARKEEPQRTINIPKINGHINGVTSNPESNRPKRAGKKRSYVDASFEGYGEGFDEGKDDASSDAESRQSSNGRKKRRKSSNNLSPSVQSGYSLGMPPQNTLSRGISSYASRG